MKTEALIPVAFLCFGLLIAFHPTLFSGFRLYQPGSEDPRFVNYMLEHTWLWVTQAKNHATFWNLPIFYPLKDVTAYSDTYLGAAPFYWIWRLLGIREITAYQLWLIVLCIINFLAAFWVLKRMFPLQTTGASVGAFLFAFGFPRIVQMAHSQLLPQFYTLFAIYAIDRIFHSQKAEPGWIAVFLVCCVLQFYTGFYMAWFFGISLLVCLIVSLTNGAYRKGLFDGLARNRYGLLLGMVIGAILLYPLASKYWTASVLMGGREFHDVYPALIYQESWYYLGEESWFYFWQENVGTFRFLETAHEQRLGVGIFTLIFSVVGLIRNWGNPKIKLFLIVSIVLGLLAMRWPGTEFTLWKWIFLYVPGADAIRAVSRIGILLLIPFAAGVGLLIQQVWKGRGYHWAFLMIVIVVLEQGITTGAEPKSEHEQAVHTLAAQITAQQCDAFFYLPDRGYASVWNRHLDAMWAGMKAGIPTINGYSSNFPPGWPFDEPHVYLGGPEAVQRALADWKIQENLHDQNICWIRQSVRAAGESNSTGEATLP